MRRLVTFVLFVLQAITGYGQYDQVNSVYDEQYPIITPDGTVMYFTRANHPDNAGGKKDKGDIWYSTLVDSRWSTPVHAGAAINNKKWNGILGFSQNGSNMLLHHHYQDDKQGLSISGKRSDGWTIPVSLEIPYFLNKSALQSGSISNDGKVIILSLESYNTKGAEDLYVLFRQSDGSWSDPENLGKDINTTAQEISPYLSEDNKTLFFASNGYSEGRGSFDIYKTVREDDTWVQWSFPKNLGKEVNTQGRESSYQYFADTKTAMYVSTLDSDGYGDIKSIKRKEDIEEHAGTLPDIKEKEVVFIDTVSAKKPVTFDGISEVIPSRFTFSGTVKSTITDKFPEATLLLTAVDGEQFTEQFTDNGTFSIPLQSSSYHLEVEAKGYLSKFLTVHTDSIAMQYHIIMSPIVVGEIVNLQSVLFGRGTDKLLRSSYNELNAVVKMMEANPDMEIFLGGHTDNQGSSKLNYELSEKRIRAVKKYLQSKGISQRRIEGKGYGGSKPIFSNKNEEMRRLNRRVEFTVTKK